MATELDTLRLLHSIRQDLFAYNNPNTSHCDVKKLIEEYIALLPEEVAIQTYQKVIAELKEKASQTGFDLEKWRKISLQDVDTAKAETKNIKRENAERNDNNKKFRQEEAIKQKIINELRFKNYDVDGKDLVSVNFEDGKKLSATFSDGSIQIINTAKYKGKQITAGFWRADKEKRKDYLSQAQLQLIIDNNGMTFTTEKKEILSEKSACKKMSLNQYQKVAGPIPNIEEEYEIYSRLSFINEQKFLSEVKVRKAYMDNISKVCARLSHDAKNLSKLKQIADQTILLQRISEALDVSSQPIVYKDALNIIPLKSEQEQTVKETLKQLIEEDIKGEPGKQHIWSSFDKTIKNPRYSPYEILLDKAVSSSLMVHSEIFHFDSKEQMRNNIAKAMSEIKSQNKSILPLPNSLAAEILCVGVFNTGMKRAQNEDDLAKMNAILNEFGLNIHFEKREITKVPPQETSNEYLRAEREAFREDRDHKQFNHLLERANIGKLLNKKEVHHFLPLRYNGFIDEELNKKTNYVAVASEHEYNLDFHGLGHTFDTPTVSLVLNNSGEISSQTYSQMRKDGLGKTLLIPILQLKKDKEFEDVLSVQTQQRISTDKTSVCYAQVPEYLPTLIREKEKTAEI